jgi:hypothetical protein
VRSANSQISSDLAFELAGVGNDVHVIRYDAPQARLPAAADVQGVHIHRVSSTEFGRGALLGRSVDCSSFYASMWRAMNELAGPNSILITKTDPPLTSMPAMLTRRRGAKLINWLQDIYPEVAIELGVPLVGGILGRWLRRWRDASLKAPVRNVQITASRRPGDRHHRCGWRNRSAGWPKRLRHRNPSLLAEMGRRARSMRDAQFTRMHALGRWRQ